jgi:CRISPR/Cas system endoribonuclease Cas6 (RAMP superfamily)
MASGGLWSGKWKTEAITASPQTHAARNALPFPEPIPLLTQAIQHWQRLTGACFPCSASELVQASGCVLSTYAFHTVDIPFCSGVQIGYLGWADYTCLRPQTEESAAITALARLAFFTGWGYETACGFGTARVVFRKRGG